MSTPTGPNDPDTAYADSTAFGDLAERTTELEADVEDAADAAAAAGTAAAAAEESAAITALAARVTALEEAP